jgi:hypothetical protein
MRGVYPALPTFHYQKPESHIVALNLGSSHDTKIELRYLFDRRHEAAGVLFSYSLGDIGGFLRPLTIAHPCWCILF